MANKTNEPLEAIKKAPTAEKEQIKADESGGQPETQTAKENVQEPADGIAPFIAPYVKAYPTEKSFHVTSDKQVFLEKDRNLAVLHQNSLKNSEQVQTIKVK